MDRFQQASEAFERLCRVMAELRAPGGCPWDREQTLESLRPYLIEETYEVLDALDADNLDGHREELGDLLLQVVFQAEIRNETGEFSVADVATAIGDKLVRRHPHVFGNKNADNASGATKNCEEVKSAERAQRAKRAESRGCLDGIPRSLPALLRAYRAGEKAAAVGFDWRSPEGVKSKIKEEWAELQDASTKLDSPEQRAHAEEEMGDLLFALVNLCRHLNIEPETALGRAVDKFSDRFRFVEKTLAAKEQRPADVPLDELHRLWEEAKTRRSA